MQSSCAVIHLCVDANLKSTTYRAYELFEGAAALGHSKSKELLAEGLLFGDDVARDVERSLTLYEELASIGSPKGQMVCILII